MKRISTSKLILCVLFLIGVQIIIFSEIWTWHTGDGTGIQTLIGIAATMMASYIGYLIKSLKENTVGGIVYDLAIQEKNLECEPGEEEYDPEEEVIIVEEEEK